MSFSQFAMDYGQNFPGTAYGIGGKGISLPGTFQQPMPAYPNLGFSPYARPGFGGGGQMDPFAGIGRALTQQYIQRSQAGFNNPFTSGLANYLQAPKLNAQQNALFASYGLVPKNPTGTAGTISFGMGGVGGGIATGANAPGEATVGGGISRREFLSGGVVKPSGHTTKRLVFVAPTEYSGKIKNVELIDANGKVIEQGKYRSSGNPHKGIPRGNYDFSKHGSGYDSTYGFRVTLDDGSVKTHY